MWINHRLSTRIPSLFLVFLLVLSGAINIIAWDNSYDTNVNQCDAAAVASKDTIDERPLKICILSEPNPITYVSGQSGRFRALLQHLTEHHPNDQVHLVTADVSHPNPPTDCFGGSIPIHYTRGFQLPHYPSLTLSFDITFQTLRLLLSQQQESKFDLIHVSSPGLLIFPAILASRWANLPLVMSYHTHLPVYVRTYLPSPWNSIVEWWVWKALKLVHSMADLTLVTSPQMAEEMAQRNIPNVEVWRKGINTTRFHPDYESSEMRQRMSDGHPDELLLVYIGRLAKEKRLQDLKAILQQLNNHNNNKTTTTMTTSVRLCFVGSGPEEEELREYFQGTSTTFLGRLDGLELSQAFASGDIFVMPSDSETLGFVVLESMASGVPCIAARAGGLIDLVDHGTTGFLVPTGDVDAFCDAIERLHSHPDLYRRISAAGRQETERWSWYASMEHLRRTAYPQAIQNVSLRRWKRALRWFRQ